MTPLKTFDPRVDGGYQDECGCDETLSCWCNLSKQMQVCSCACHIEIAEDALKRCAALEEEVEMARKRLGPAGYRILGEVTRLEKENAELVRWKSDAERSMSLMAITIETYKEKEPRP